MSSDFHNATLWSNDGYLGETICRLFHAIAIFLREPAPAWPQCRQGTRGGHRDLSGWHGIADGVSKTHVTLGRHRRILEANMHQVIYRMCRVAQLDCAGAQVRTLRNLVQIAELHLRVAWTVHKYDMTSRCHLERDTVLAPSRRLR